MPSSIFGHNSHPTIVSWFAHLRSVRVMEKHLSPLGLRPIHALALYLLSSTPEPIESHDMCSQLGIGRRTGLRLSVFLHDHKLASRTVRSEDHEIREYLELTEHGKAILAVALKLDEAADSEFMSGLTAKDCSEAMRFLTVMATGESPRKAALREVIQMPLREAK